MPTVEICGRLYNIRGEDKAETIRVLASNVHRRVRQIAERADTSDEGRLAILAALNIADDLYQTRKALERRGAEIAEQAQELARSLDAVLAGPNDDTDRTSSTGTDGSG
jgi:cell division protein ZapA